MRNNRFLFDETRQSPAGMVSVSQLQSFMSCPKKWEYGYVENLTPRVERPYLGVGKLCHKGMQEAMYVIWHAYTVFGASMHDRPQIYVNAKAVGLDAMDKMWKEHMDSNAYLEEEIPEQEQMLVDARAVFDQAFDEFEDRKSVV